MAKGKGKRRPAKRRKTARTKQRIAKFAGKKTRAEIREYAKYVPSLEKLKGKRTLTASEVGQLTRAKKRLRHTENLKPLTAAQAKALKKSGRKDLIVGDGVRAIRLRNTAPNAKVRVHKDGVVVTSNGRTWEYHPVNPPTPDNLSREGAKLLRRKDVVQIHLWTTRGRANEFFTYTGDEDEEDGGELEGGWNAYLYNRFTQYVQQQDFTVGIAALIDTGRKKGGK